MVIWAEVEVEGVGYISVVILVGGAAEGVGSIVMRLGTLINFGVRLSTKRSRSGLTVLSRV